MDEIIHLRIKKEYASSLINHLKNEDAIELLDEEIGPIPEWQKEAVRKTYMYAMENKKTIEQWDDIKKEFDERK